MLEHNIHLRVVHESMYETIPNDGCGDMEFWISTTIRSTKDTVLDLRNSMGRVDNNQGLRMDCKTP